MKAAKPARVYLDRAEQIAALLDAASELDREAHSNGRIAQQQGTKIRLITGDLR